MDYKRFGTMVDCSRNAVMTVPTVKKWLDLCAEFGHNMFSLYIEDTYEVDDNPYFGYGRGRYSKEELKEIDDYAYSKGIEVIPCIQTLAHLNAIVRWLAYKMEIVDCDDILLAGEEKVYVLIDNMFKTMKECFRTNMINIGMDEAHMIGRGKYYDIHGDTDRTKILVDHLNRVSEIAKKYGYNLTMWSDMFFRLATGGSYYVSDAKIDASIKEMIPDNVEIVYWDYYTKDKKKYDKMFKAHKQLTDDVWFAGGLWTWEGFTPVNKFSIKATKAALQSCKYNNVKNVMLTLWGDNGAECSKFAVLPSLFCSSEFAKGNYNMADIKAKFKARFGIAFDRFMYLDVVDGSNTSNPTKYLLYNDLFIGLMDTYYKEGATKEFAKMARKLAPLTKDETYGYLFETQCALCKVLALKADMGLRIRKAYKDNDKEELKVIIKDLKKLSKLLKKFYIAFRNQWMIENKPHGFDVQDVRLGGLMNRVEHCAETLQGYVDGKLDKVLELEEELLDYYCGEKVLRENGYAYLNMYKHNVTANVL